MPQERGCRLGRAGLWMGGEEIVLTGILGVTIFPGSKDVSEYRHHGLEARATKYIQPDALPGKMVAFMLIGLWTPEIASCLRAFVFNPLSTSLLAPI